MKKTIVISAINAFEGGVLSVLQDCLRELREASGERFEIIALVNDKTLVGVEGVRYLQFPKNRFLRLYYEYWYFYRLSKLLQPDVWVSLADVTPRVIAPVRVVYCHNLAPFYRLTWQDAWFDPILAIYHLIFRYIYRINITKNRYVVVQQQWLRQAFEEMFGLTNVVVARPSLAKTFAMPSPTHAPAKPLFFYSSIPRVFKNFEAIAEAAALLEKKGIIGFEVVFTLDGSENRYARYIYQKYSHLATIKWLGKMNRKAIFEYYALAEVVIFPSKIETWGLGISEAILFDKPIFALDAPYAKETVGNYPKVKFFDTSNRLAQIMEDCLERRLVFDKNEAPTATQPSVEHWRGLFQLLLSSEV